LTDVALPAIRNSRRSLARFASPGSGNFPFSLTQYWACRFIRSAAYMFGRLALKCSRLI
jgi:hypothetical protein